MKVYANGPDTCSMGNGSTCHSFSKKEFAGKISALMGAHTDKKHKTPKF
jgi:hypothetical protein